MLPEALAAAAGYFAYYWLATALAVVLPHIVASIVAAATIGGAVYAIAEWLLVEYGAPPTVYWILRVTVYAAVAPALIILADFILNALALPDFVHTILIGATVLALAVLLIRINGAIASRAGQEALIERAREKRQRRRDLH